MKKITLKELVILFQEWQMETKAPNYNFAHNGVANNFMEQNGLENFLFCEKADADKINEEARYYGRTEGEIKSFEKGAGFAIELMVGKQEK